MIRQIVQFSRQPDIRHRIAFVPDYDIAVARVLFQGSDVWLNNPRRPMEACGTSGEKAALNGALNCSVLDGWWDEMFDGENGWAISSAEAYDDLARRDEVEAASLYDLLERQIIPLFYDRRDEAGVPRHWVRRVRASMQSLGPQVTASRMLRDYVEQLYEPTAAHTDALTADGNARARALAAWKERVSPRRGQPWPCARSRGPTASPSSVRPERSLPSSPWADSTRTTSPCSSSTVRSARTTSSPSPASPR